MKVTICIHSRMLCFLTTIEQSCFTINPTYPRAFIYTTRIVAKKPPSYLGGFSLCYLRALFVFFAREVVFFFGLAFAFAFGFALALGFREVVFFRGLALDFDFVRREAVFVAI